MEKNLSVLIIANPVGGSFKKDKFEQAVEIVKSKLGNAHVVYTEYAGHATEIVAASEASIVISAGGDGIVNEVVNGLQGKQSIFFPLAFGTANVFCREHGISPNPIKAAKQVDFNRLKSLYLGKISNRYFVQMVGFGYDAEAVRTTNLNLKKKIGVGAYMWSGFVQLIKNDSKPFVFFHKGEEVAAHHSVIAVGRKYAGQFNLTRNKSKNKLLVCHVQGSSRLLLLKVISSILLGLGFGGRRIESDAIKVVGSTYCQLDGDLFELENSTNFIVINEASFMLAY